MDRPTNKYCAGPGQPNRGQCVPCTNNGHCSAPTAYCVDQQCVECNSHAHCASKTDTPQCTDN
jgi:hypothetical protein